MQVEKKRFNPSNPNPLAHLNFQRLGRVVNPEELESTYTHAAYPVPWVLPSGKIMVYFTMRNQKNQSCIVSLDIKWSVNGLKPIGFNPTPILEGSTNGFDKDGTSIGNIVKVEDKYLLYTLGWNLQSDVPWRNTIGMASATMPSGPFVKNTDPIIPLSDVNPHSMSYPWVVKIEDEYHCYFGSNLIWGETNNEMEHVIKQATSADGENWTPQKEILIGLDQNLTAASRPSVIPHGKGYLMLFSGKNRLGKYSLHAAKSDDGNNWILLDMEIEGQPEAWESEECTYPALFTFDNEIYALYNGNNFGKTGFGLLKLKA